MRRGEVEIAVIYAGFWTVESGPRHGSTDRLKRQRLDREKSRHEIGKVSHSEDFTCRFVSCVDEF